ncbi:MAG: response regulator transcription factor [Peptostreptococcaceae bacterium]
MNILVVDDEKEIVDLIDLYLRKNYNIIKAYDGKDGLTKINSNKIDLAIVDIMMPNMDGYTLIENIRKDKEIPIIIISAKTQSYDKIIGLDIGADDYITKPFDPLELVARVKSQLRRYNRFANIENKSSQIKVRNLMMDTESFRVEKDGQEIHLTSTEYKILELMMTNKNKVFTKKNIFESVWGEHYYNEDNAIMVHISKLRDKIEDKNNQYIKTIRGLGYKFNGEE